MSKPKVVFAFTEAGMGHIMPLKSILTAFEKKYGDKVECVSSYFFTETDNKYLKKFELFLVNEVKRQNKFNWYGYFTTFAMDVFGTKIGSGFLMKALRPKTVKPALEHLKELEADVFVSTHWATNYYAMQLKNRPLTAVYVPDVFINPLFRYPSDVVLCSQRTGYDEAKTHKKRFNQENLKLVPFCIREEAYKVSKNKSENRKLLGIDENKFTVSIAEGGYGLGKMEDICKIALKRNLNVTILALCGKNKELYNRLLALPKNPKTNIVPVPFKSDLFTEIAASDLFCGKSGNMIAEPCFYGVPQIITKHTTNIETHIADYYVKYLKTAENVFNPNKVVDKIEEYMKTPSLLDKFKISQDRINELYGAEKAADEIFELLKTKFPNI